MFATGMVVHVKLQPIVDPQLIVFAKRFVDVAGPVSGNGSGPIDSAEAPFVAGAGAGP
jgi:hypothetical protein